MRMMESRLLAHSSVAYTGTRLHMTHTRSRGGRGGFGTR